MQKLRIERVLGVFSDPQISSGWLELRSRHRWRRETEPWREAAASRAGSHGGMVLRFDPGDDPRE